MGWKDAPVVEGQKPAWAGAPVVEDHTPGAVESTLRNVLNAATFNTMPMIAAAGDATIPGINSGTSAAPSWSKRYHENLTAQRGQDAAGQSAHPYASFAGSVGGGFLNPITRALPIPKTLGGAVGQGAAIGGGYGAGTGLSDQKDMLGIAKDVALGAGTGGALGGAFHGLGRALRPLTKSPDAVALEAEGVLPTIGQQLGGSAQRAEDALTSTPILGDAIKNRQLDAITGFNRATYDRALAPLGVKYPLSAPVGNDAVDTVGGIISKAYKQAYQGASIPNNQPLQANLQAIVADAGNVLPADRVALVQKNIDRLINSKFDQNGNLPSDMLETAKNWFAEQSRAGSSAGLDERAIASAYGQVLNTIKSEVANSDPNRAALLSAADKAYANFVRVSGAASSNNASAKGGLFSPNQLGQAIRAADDSTRKGSFAKGNALMQDLAQKGQHVLTQTVPDSGTPFRSFITNPVAALSAPLSLPMLGAASSLYSPTGQNVMRGMLFGAPQARAALSKIPPYALPGALGLIGSQGPSQ